jgi:hypothetical protein
LVGSSRRENVRPPEEHLREQDPQLVARVERAHGTFVTLGRDAQADQQLGRLALGGVPVVVRDDALELGEADADRVVHVAREKLLLLDHGRPELGLAGHDGVENARVVVDRSGFARELRREAAPEC